VQARQCWPEFNVIPGTVEKRTEAKKLKKDLLIKSLRIKREMHVQANK